jgi:hypothetical protein
VSNIAQPPATPSTDDTTGHVKFIESALATEGGYLRIGRGGFSLHFAGGARLSGYDCETIKAECIGAGLPVIDSREAPFEKVARLAICGPLIAVDRAPDPRPYNPLSYAPLSYVADTYRAIGAEVVNLPDAATTVAEREPG